MILMKSLEEPLNELMFVVGVYLQLQKERGLEETHIEERRNHQVDLYWE
jgi:hypothetical protein